MGKYWIVAASPKGEENHLNSRFKVWRENDNGRAASEGWKSIHDISDLLQAGHTVLTGQDADDKIFSGEAVELELRIAKNGKRFKISDMPDD